MLQWLLGIGGLSNAGRTACVSYCNSVLLTEWLAKNWWLAAACRQISERGVVLAGLYQTWLHLALQSSLPFWCYWLNYGIWGDVNTQANDNELFPIKLFQPKSLALSLWYKQLFLLHVSSGHAQQCMSCQSNHFNRSSKVALVQKADLRKRLWTF